MKNKNINLNISCKILKTVKLLKKEEFFERRNREKCYFKA